ncbi:hypothetical protein TNCV_5078751 [Trichonephila clavipes]|nr:hypothetical protein TNCV_5078751 [Trichonephila clavipes]
MALSDSLPQIDLGVEGGTQGVRTILNKLTSDIVKGEKNVTSLRDGEKVTSKRSQWLTESGSRFCVTGPGFKIRAGINVWSRLGSPRQPLIPRETLFPALAGCNWKQKTPASDPRSERGQRDRREDDLKTFVESGYPKETPPSQTTSFEL